MIKDHRNLTEICRQLMSEGRRRAGEDLEVFFIILIASGGIFGATIIVCLYCWLLLQHLAVIKRRAQHYNLRYLFALTTVVAIVLGALCWMVRR